MVEPDRPGSRGTGCAGAVNQSGAILLLKPKAICLGFAD
jgi:hypothetical protein